MLLLISLVLVIVVVYCSNSLHFLISKLSLYYNTFISPTLKINKTTDSLTLKPTYHHIFLLCVCVSLWAGVQSSEVMVAQLTTQMLVMLVQIALILVFMFPVFQLPCKGSMLWVVLLSVLQGFCGMTFGGLDGIIQKSLDGS